MLSIGLTGGIGSGKSTIASILQHMGFAVYIADTEAAHLMNTLPEIRKDMKQLFGDIIYTAPNVLNKTLLADIIFQNPQALTQVNQIVHPRVINDFQSWKRQQKSLFVFFESAILFEAHLSPFFDAIICVTASEATRLQRVVQRDRTTSDKVKARMLNQLEDTEKCRQSDFIIYNDTNHMVIQQVIEILDILKERQNNKR